MKKVLMTFSALLVSALAFTAPASAWERVASGSSSFSGLTGTVMTGDLVGSLSGSIGSDNVNTNTNPWVASSDASLNQVTGGLGASSNLVQGELIQNGETSAEADVNGFDWETEAADTSTTGTGSVLGAATGDVSGTVAGLGATSHEHSSATDQQFGGSDYAHAQQSVGGFVASGAASGGAGTHLSQTEALGESASTSTANH